jgi:hypothetical protein
LHFGARAVLFGAGGVSTSGPRTIREPRVHHVFIQFFRIRASIFRGVRSLLQGVCRTVHVWDRPSAKGPRTVRRHWTVHRLSSSHLYCPGAVLEVLLVISDCPSEGHRPSVRSLRTIRLDPADLVKFSCILSCDYVTLANSCGNLWL